MRFEKGRFKEKHASEALTDPEIALAVKQKMINGTVTCTDAATIAADLHKTMQETGVVLDILEVSLSKCQLGLFGYENPKKIVTPALSVGKEMKAAITKGLLNGRLSCEAAWKIAAALALPKIDVSSACEALKIKIKPCQLGAF
jgi:hypothetical protein